MYCCRDIPLTNTLSHWGSKYFSNKLKFLKYPVQIYCRNVKKNIPWKISEQEFGQLSLFWIENRWDNKDEPRIPTLFATVNHIMLVDTIWAFHIFLESYYCTKLLEIYNWQINTCMWNWVVLGWRHQTRSCMASWGSMWHQHPRVAWRFVRYPQVWRPGSTWVWCIQEPDSGKVCGYPWAAYSCSIERGSGLVVVRLVIEVPSMPPEERKIVKQNCSAMFFYNRNFLNGIFYGQVVTSSEVKGNFQSAVFDASTCDITCILA